MRHLGLILIFLLSFLTAYSQVGNGGILVVNDPYNNPYVTKTSKRGDFKNLIKVGILSPFRGVFELGYERLLPEGFSIEGFAGITYRDFAFERLKSNGLYNSTFVNAGLGYSGKLALKYYPFSQGWFSGVYFSNEAGYRKYNFKANLVETTANGASYNRQMNIGYEFTEVKLFLGQNLANYTGRFFIDYKVGLIFRHVNATYPEFVNNGNGTQYKIARSDRFGPALGFNILAGYAF